MSIIISAIIVVALIGIDQLTKFLAETYLLGKSGVTIINNIIEFRFSYNTGAAFSMFENFSLFPLIISVLGAILLLYFFKEVGFKRRPLYSISLCMIYAGTWGNLIDRFLMAINQKEGVVDFINFLFMDFAIFNFADICLTVGMAIMCVYIFFYEPKDPLKLFKKKEKGEIEDAEGN
jgi:signal peptidase II